MPAEVVVVEDEALTRRALALALRKEGYNVTEASDVYACRAALRHAKVDIVILDLGLPGPDGLELASELGGDPDIGILVVTARSSPEARIQALDLGADDYLVKPVHLGELAARVRSVLRRRGRGAPRKRLGPWLLDLEARTVSAGGADTPGLTRGEFEILARLVEAEGKIVSREALSRAVSRRDGADLRSVDSLVSRLRRKLGDLSEAGGLIVTAPGFGYRLRAPAEDA